MPDLSIEALTGALALATVLLVFVTGLLAVANWRAASAAKRSADAVVREFRLTRRPRLTVKWEARSLRRRKTRPQYGVAGDPNSHDM